MCSMPTTGWFSPATAAQRMERDGESQQHCRAECAQLEDCILERRYSEESRVLCMSRWCKCDQARGDRDRFLKGIEAHRRADQQHCGEAGAASPAADAAAAPVVDKPPNAPIELAPNAPAAPPIA